MLYMKFFFSFSWSILKIKINKQPCKYLSDFQYPKIQERFDALAFLINRMWFDSKFRNPPFS